MSERWFFALWPDEATRRILAERVRVQVPAGARAAHPLDLHLTLVFLGELERDRLVCAESAADELAAARVDLTFDRLGVFPRPGVLWYGPAQTPDALLDLVEGLQRALCRCGIAPERRPYRAHMTLARRVRTPQPEIPVAPLTWQAREFVLAAGDAGAVPRYRVRRRWPLGPPVGQGVSDGTRAESRGSGRGEAARAMS